MCVSGGIPGQGTRRTSPAKASGFGTPGGVGAVDTSQRTPRDPEFFREAREAGINPVLNPKEFTRFFRGRRGAFLKGQQEKIQKTAEERSTLATARGTVSDRRRRILSGIISRSNATGGRLTDDSAILGYRRLLGA